MKTIKAELDSGVLHDYRRKIVETLIYKVDAELHAETYEGNRGNDMYAEPEFTGKYLDLCMKLFRVYHKEEVLQNAEKVVDSILANQRADGYLGCLPEGKEFLNFSVWNQAFTVLGLISYYEGTGDLRALEAAGKSVSYTMDYFMEGKGDILDALNGGTQHISILYFICKLYKVTKEEKYKKYILFIVETIRNSELNFLEFSDILELKSRKGIENFIILLGILEYADIFGDKEAVLSVEKYWQQVADTQIRNTGNGTIGEFWTEGGGGCMLLGPEIKANETCVAVGWMELSLALFYLKQDVKYLDALDKTLYNHILASVAEDGSDFAYYQPNFGKKIRATGAGLYKCCRYRGFTLFSYMDEMLYYEDENTLLPMLYTSGNYCSEDTKVVMETDYPFDGTIHLEVTSQKEKYLKLRVPAKCTAMSLTVDGKRQEISVSEGYLVIRLQKNATTAIELLLENQFGTEYGFIDGKEYAAFSYGCLLLAAKDVAQDRTLDKENLIPQNRIPDAGERIGFTIDGVSYCEYAAADDYSVWMPLHEPWYKKAWRRHLCDMHIDDWNPEFLSQFDPGTYVENLKRANVKNAMIYFQSHVGLCYYPTKAGKMHHAFVGKEDMMKQVEKLCHEAGISVTGYYSLIYNNWAHDEHPDWRIVGPDGMSAREKCLENDLDFAAKGVTRYGTCCPNNMEYRAFVKEQLHEMADYFDFEGFFFDMLFWPGELCFCENCKARWEREVGKVNMPGLYDTDDPNWELHIEKRREWMGEFAMWARNELKAVAPHASVEHNLASAITHVNHRCADERVNDACDYAGGDLYDDLYRHSFACKFYRNLTKNQPFEYMFSRCDPDLGRHTTIKSKDAMASAMFLTAAHHGATLIIDAIDPVGTMDERVYQQIGEIYEKQIPYESHLEQGSMIEDIGLYYSFKSKPVIYTPLSNHDGALFAAETLIRNHLSFGAASSCIDIDRFKTLIVPCPGPEDAFDNERLINYVENGGKLYFSGTGDAGLLKTFFGAECEGMTEERITYIAPNGKCPEAFGWFNEKYPLQFEENAPIVRGIDPEHVIATITLPYTKQDELKFASIHSNPPGIATKLPSVAVKAYGKGMVMWSAFPIECRRTTEYKSVFYLLLKHGLKPELTLLSDAPQDVEVIGFHMKDGIQINAILLNENETARKVEDFSVSVRCETCPQQVMRVPDGEAIPFCYENSMVTFTVSELPIFAMYEIKG